MANGPIVFNVAKGSQIEYIRRAIAGTGGAKIVWCAFASSGLEPDATLIDRLTLNDIVAGSGDVSIEATFSGYSKQDAAGLALATMTTGISGHQDADCTNPSWSPTSAEVLGKIIAFYDPTGSHTASAMIPIFGDAWLITTPSSGTVTYDTASGGFIRAT